MQIDPNSHISSLFIPFPTTHMTFKQEGTCCANHGQNSWLNLQKSLQQCKGIGAEKISFCYVSKRFLHNQFWLWQAIVICKRIA